MLQTDLICDMPEIVLRLFLVLQSFSVHKGNGVDNKVAMQMLCIQVRCHNHLKPLAPHHVCKLYSNLLRLLRRDLIFLKAQITVIGLNPIRLVVLLLNRNKLVTGGRHIAVDTLAEKFPFGFFFVLRIGKNIFECLIFFLGVFGIGGLFRIGCIVDDLTEPFRYLPKLAYCNFSPLFSGRRNSRSISA